MSEFKVSYTRLNSGNYIVRPSSALGTCGSYPFPWDCGVGKTLQKALDCFWNNHEKHLKGYIALVCEVEK